MRRLSIYTEILARLLMLLVGLVLIIPFFLVSVVGVLGELYVTSFYSAAAATRACIQKLDFKQ